MAEAWAIEIRDQCRAAEVAFFFKQWGGVRPKSGGRFLCGREWNMYPTISKAAVTRRPENSSRAIERIVGKFEGLETTLGEIERFVVRHTPFRETHYKKVLQALEEADKIVPVNLPATRRRGTYADMNMRLSFKPNSQD